MTRLAKRMDALRSQGRKSLVVYLTAGDPDPATALAAAWGAIRGGADVLEVGVPFSDPVADGPVIQRAMGRALAAGGGLAGALELIASLRSGTGAGSNGAPTGIPIVLFGYVNPLLAAGAAVFERIAEAGADAVLLVDVPPEEAAPFREAAAAAGLDWVCLVAPTSGADRARAIAERATGFLYIVSMTGVTGGALSGLDAVEPTLRAVREATTLPACIGFGVRDRESARLAASAADGVVVGSAVVRALEEGLASGDGPARVAAVVADLRAGIDAAGAGGRP